MEFLPLGGVIPSADEIDRCRIKIRKELHLEKEFLFVHSGKLSPEKRTAELIRAFTRVNELKARLVIIGSMPEETEKELTELINYDNRISYLGWKSSDQLMEYLAAGDLYCQPGSCSATLQNAICCRAAVMARPMESYTMLDKGNFFWVEGEDDIYNLFKALNERPQILENAKANAEICAREYLDYQQMEKKIISEGKRYEGIGE